MTEDELSIPQIAKIANVSEKTVRDWMDAGKFPVSQTKRQGQQRRRYATKADVDQWLASLKEGETTPEATSRPTNTPETENCQSGARTDASSARARDSGARCQHRRCEA